MAPIATSTASSAKRGRQPLKKPFSTRARISITKQTTRLIERRVQLQAQLMRDFERRFRRQPLGDKIPRRELRRLTKVLIRREKQYLGAMTKIVQDQERLGRLDPSLERSIDLDLVKSQLQRFERGLGPNLAEREDSSSSSATSDTSSSKRENANGPKQAHNHTSDTSTSTSDTSTATVDTRAENKPVEKSPLEKERVEKKQEAQDSAKEDMFGAFDDVCRPQLKKRKRQDEEKERPKEAKKERKEQPAKTEQPTAAQTSANVQAATSQATKATKTTPTGKNLPLTGKNAAVEKMAQSNSGRVNGVPDKKQQNPTLRIHGRTYEVEKLPAQYDVESDDDVPLYKKIAMAMMQPDYNDHVHTLARKRKPPYTRIPMTMSGALMKNPETDGLGAHDLPTPPVSDEADNANGQAFKNRRAAFKKRRVSPAVTEPRASATPRSKNNQQKPRSVGSAP